MCYIYHATALKDDPHYVKALQRRAASNETLDTWTSLSSAQEGAFSLTHSLVSLLPSVSLGLFVSVHRVAVVSFVPVPSYPIASLLVRSLALHDPLSTPS